MKNQAINDRSSNKLYGLILIGILLFMSLCYLSSSLFFYINNKETIGIITKIEPYNSYCGSKNKYECTTYSTTIYLDKIDFSSPFSIKIDSYSAKGHNQPIPLSKYQVGQSIELFVNPNQVLMPDGAYNGVEIKELLLRRILIFSIISIIFTGVFIFFIKSSKKNSSINLQNAN